MEDNVSLRAPVDTLLNLALTTHLGKKKGVKAVETLSSLKMAPLLMENEMAGIKIAQMTIHQVKVASAAIFRTFTKSQLENVLIQEPWTYQN